MEIILIGVGLIAKYYVKGLKKANFNIVALVDLDENPSSLDYYPNLNLYNNLSKVQEKAKTVLIATPPKTHFNLIKQALEIGYNVIVEKPGFINLKEMEELLIMADEKGLFIKTMFHWQHAIENIKFKKYLKLDTLKAIVLNFYEPYASSLKKEKKYRLTGGIYLDNHVNVLSYLSLFLDINDLQIINKKEIFNASKKAVIVQLTYNYFGIQININYNWTKNKKTKISQFIYQNNDVVKINHNLERIYINKQVVNSHNYKNRLEKHYIGVFKNINNYDFNMMFVIHKHLFKAINFKGEV